MTARRVDRDDGQPDEARALPLAGVKLRGFPRVLAGLAARH